MTFRISLQVLIVFLIISPPFGAQAALDLPDKNWIKVYQTNLMEFISPGSDYVAATPGRHSQWVSYLVNQVLSWQPLDLKPRPQNECELFKLKESLQKASRSEVRTQILEDYYSKCRFHFSEGPSNSLMQALKIFSMHYQIDENPFLHRVVFHLPDGQKLKGVLALKDTKKRPLVIVRAGITGNVEEAFAERFFFYQLFERGLFNVLLVENMTSADYIHFNQTLNFGGLAEAYQNIWLAQTLKSNSQPFSKLIQSVHLMGLSLGGQGVLTAAKLALYQENPQIFSSYLALCPLVNTKETFDQLFKKSDFRFPLEFWARSRFSEFINLRPELFKGFFGFPSRLLEAVAKDYKKPSADLLGLKEPEFLKKKNDFYSLHELSNWDLELQNSVWIWVTKDDSVVPVKLNTDKLRNIRPFQINEGHHCSFPVVWDGRIMSAIFEGHILGNSGFKTETKSVRLEVNPDLKWNVTDIVFHDDKPIIEVELSAAGLTKSSFIINLSDLDFEFRNNKLSEHEKFMVRRWISSQLKWERNGTDLSLLLSWPKVK